MSSGQAPGKSRFLLAWSLAWGIFAVLQVTQGIWLSCGAAYPGDLGDGRFNQLVLEHGYLSLRGFYHWSSPAQFFPTPNTLGLSDTHAGTLPIYALLRWIGFSMENAWQAWFVVVAAFNVLAAFRLFRALGIAPWLHGPIVFAAVSSVLMVWVTGTHMQMLPIFPGLLAWAELVLWCRQRQPDRLLAASGYFGWQFAAGPYIGFFWLTITLAVGILRALASRALPPSKRARNEAVLPRRLHWLRAGAIALCGWSLATVVAVVYAKAIEAGAGRSMAEIWYLAPSWKSWLTAPPIDVWYPRGGFGGQADVVEHAWFAGVLPWLMSAAALAVGWRKRHTPAGVWMLATAGGAFAIVLFFTKWGETGPGAWITVADWLPPLRAFRASGRIAVLIQVVEVSAVGVLLTTWLATVRHQGRIVPILVASLLAFEGLAAHQPTTRLDVARQRSDAMIAAWRRAGGRPVLAFAYGYANQSETLFHLDAWSAALRLKKATLNGFSGGIPGSHLGFIWNPTVENARALIAATGLPPEEVSIVESFGPEANTALGITQREGRPVAPLEGFGLQPFAWKLFAPLEHYTVDGGSMYQFTPPAEVKFRLPDGATRISVLQMMRAGSYDGSGHSDGVGITWVVQSPVGDEKPVWQEYFNPRDHPEHRGIVRRELSVPSGIGRVLILRTDTGPAQNPAWDWPLFGSLHAE
jgi:hypothetical protein